MTDVGPDEHQRDTWPHERTDPSVLLPAADWKAAYAKIHTYPVITSFGDIKVGAWGMVARKAGGQDQWTYSIRGRDLARLRKERSAGTIYTMQVAYPGESDRRDFGLIAMRRSGE